MCPGSMKLSWILSCCPVITRQARYHIMVVFLFCQITVVSLKRYFVYVCVCVCVCMYVCVYVCMCVCVCMCYGSEVVKFFVCICF